MDKITEKTIFRIPINIGWDSRDSSFSSCSSSSSCSVSYY